MQKVSDILSRKGNQVECVATKTTVIEALQLMPQGSKWRFFIPPHLGYGDRQVSAVIGANSTLIFDVELISF